MRIRNGHCCWPRSKWLFRFEAQWTRFGAGGNIIKKIWVARSLNQGSMDSVQNKLHLYGQDLLRWHARQIRETAKDLEDKIYQLNRLQDREGPGDGPGDGPAIRLLDHEIGLILKMEDLRWK